MQIVEKRAPSRVLVEDGMGKADQPVAGLGQDRVAVAIGLVKSLAPHRHPVNVDITVQEVIRIRAAIVTAPAVGVERGNDLRVLGTGYTEAQILNRMGGYTDRRATPGGSIMR